MFQFEGEFRAQTGKAQSRRLRKAKVIPAIIYGQKEAPVAIQLPHDALLHAQEKNEFYGSVLSLSVKGDNSAPQLHQVKVQAIQRHPFKPQIMHIDFIRAK